MLDTKLNKKDWINFDYGLTHFGMMTEGQFSFKLSQSMIIFPCLCLDMVTVAKLHTGEKPGTVESSRSTIKRGYDYLILVFLTSNIIRLFLSSFVKDPAFALYFGDFR